LIHGRRFVPTDAELRAEVQAGVDRANATAARVEQIKRFAILAKTGCPIPTS